MTAVAAYAFREQDSLGRRYPEPPHPYRGAFQRDRDRIIHSRAFRRLENKTQVFTRRYSDHFRNRLTHTLEVTQISRTVAQAMGLNADLVETLALAHDIGHPPFGHSGERALHQVMQAHGGSFDHNLQALRIVEGFELRYAAFPGLNLTFEVREGIVKHSRDYPPSAYPQFAEYLLDLRPPLEAQIIDLTDEIGYSTADLDDGFEAHLLPMDQILHDVPLFACFHRQVEAQYGRISTLLRFNETLKRLINYFVSDLIEHTCAAAAGFADSASIRRHPLRLARFSPEAEEHRQILKKFLYSHFYFHPRLKDEKEMAEQIVREMFEFYLDDPTRLPTPYQRKTSEFPLHQVVCDYLAGMTDDYILHQYDELRAGRARSTPEE